MASAEELQGERQQKYYVFYCMECRTIIGDSLARVTMNKNLKSMSLDVVCESVIITQESKTSTVGEDRGSTYFILECKSCQCPLGRMYNTTPRKLDCIRDLYTLDWNKVKTYQLGSCTNKSIKPEIQDTELMTRAMLLNLSERVEKLETLVEEIDENVELADDETDSNQWGKKRKTR